MSRLGLSSAFSRAFNGLFHGAPNRRVRRALGRIISSAQPAVSSRRRVRPCLEVLEDRINPGGSTFPTTGGSTFSSTLKPLPSTADGAANSLRADINISNNGKFIAGNNYTVTIQLAAGTYQLTLPNTAGYDTANKSGDLNISADTHNLVIQGQGTTGPNATIIDQTVADRVFHITDDENNGEKVVFKDLVITGGKAQDAGALGTAPGSTRADGGGILVDNGATATLSNVVVQSNSAHAGAGNPARGGGIFVFGGTLNIQNNSIIGNNRASGGAGGSTNGTGSGIYAAGGGVAGSGATISISDSTLTNNIATGGSFPNPTNGNGGNALGGGVYGTESGISISDSTLINNIVTGGSTPIGNGGLAAGGDVAASDGQGTGTNLTLTDCNLLDNTVQGGDSADGGYGGQAEGGSVYTTCSTQIDGCSASGNKLTGGNSSTNNGGGAFGGGVFSNFEASLTIKASTLSDNTLLGGEGSLAGTTPDLPGDIGGEAEGGGVYSTGTTQISITDSSLSDNTLTGGKGSIDNSSVVHLTSVSNESSVITANEVGGEAVGGGVVVAGGGPLPQAISATITDSTLSDNTLTGGNGTYVGGTVTGSIGGSASGGGVYVSDSFGSTPTISIAISGSTLAGNIVTGGNGSLSGAGKINGDGGIPLPGFASGGGASFSNASNATVPLVNSTIADNQVTGGTASGGGLFFGSTTTAPLTNVTVVGNQASTSGGGIDNGGGTVTLVNTLVALNGANTGPDYDGTVTKSDHNLIGKDDGSTGFTTANGDRLGTTANPLNPQLGSLANYGGPTQTIELLPGSPAIGAGEIGAVPTIAAAEGVLPANATDQRGAPRVVNGTIDIGAYEAQPQTSHVAPPPPGSGSSSPSPAPPPTLQTPPLLAFFDSLLGGVEKGNGDGTWTVTDSFFGIPLIVSTYDSSGNLMNVTFFGINVTTLFESL
jgi:hypothetical protein